MRAVFELEIRGGRLYVFGKIPYLAQENPVQIVLGKNADVRKMCINGRGDYKECESPDGIFKTYSVGGAHEDGTIHIEYDAVVEGENNILSGEVVALSLYSNIFPARLPPYIDKSTCYFGSGFEGYDIVHSYADGGRGILAKDTQRLFGEIVNIAAFRKGSLKTFETGGIRAYYRDGRSYGNLYECAALGAEALSYYNQIYPRLEGGVEWIVLGIGNAGPYNRGSLIVSGVAPQDFRMPEDVPHGFPLSEEDYRAWLKYSTFAHELSHMWFCRADTNSYEDWLNETGAEWSCLLFLLHRGERGLFRKFYSVRKYEHMLFREPIKPLDLHRPRSVHGSGVVLFYKIYERFGAETVLKILQILSRMETQCTDGLLEEVRAKLGAQTADFIQCRLCDYIEAAL